MITRLSIYSAYACVSTLTHHDAMILYNVHGILAIAIANACVYIYVHVYMHTLYIHAYTGRCFYFEHMQVTDYMQCNGSNLI